jgi:hypothetical protein
VDDLVNGFYLGGARPAATICPGVPLPGEHRVFPVPGPAGEPSAAAAPAPRDAFSTTRQRLQDTISEVNRGR